MHFYNLLELIKERKLLNLCKNIIRHQAPLWLNMIFFLAYLCILLSCLLSTNIFTFIKKYTSVNCSDISLNVAPFDSGVAKSVRHNRWKCRRYSRDSLYRSRGRKSDLLRGHNERGVGRECRAERYARHALWFCSKGCETLFDDLARCGRAAKPSWKFTDRWARQGMRHKACCRAGCVYRFIPLVLFPHAIATL